MVLARRPEAYADGEDGARPAAILNPLRLRLLESLREPASAAALARTLGMPRQKINYHLRELERDGFVELAEERKKGNCVERVMRATVNYYLMSEPGSDAAESRNQFSSTYLIALAARAIRDVAVLRERAAKEGKPLATLSLQTEVRFRSAADQHAFATELAGEVARLAAAYHDEEAPRGRRFRVFAGAYPAITKPAETQTSKAQTAEAQIKGKEEK